MPELLLAGVHARPQLVGWLKGLGVLRVVAEQVDRGARLRWRDGVAELHCSLEIDELERFFLERYAPAPVCSPWNGGSGFFPGHYSSAVAVLEQIEMTTDRRLDLFRSAIATGRRVLQELDVGTKPANQRLAIARALRGEASDAFLRWLDAALVLTEDAAAFPDLLGSGGNDGNFDIGVNYGKAALLALGLGAGAGSRRPPDRASMLASALRGMSAPLSGGSIGYFHLDISPTSAPQGEGTKFGNPWDLLLGVEGALLMAAGASRRYGMAESGADKSGASAPFTMRSTGRGTARRSPARRAAPSSGFRCGRARPACARSRRCCARDARR